jgi:hypothetical protein
MNQDDLPQQEERCTASLYTVWQLRLDKRDTLLVLQALGGRLDTQEKVEAASALCDRLTLQRAHEANILAKSLQFSADVVAKKEPTGVR